jgi:hypothetical protein
LNVFTSSVQDELTALAASMLISRSRDELVSTTAKV